MQDLAVHPVILFIYNQIPVISLRPDPIQIDLNKEKSLVPALAQGVPAAGKMGVPWGLFWGLLAHKSLEITRDGFLSFVLKPFIYQCFWRISGNFSNSLKSVFIALQNLYSPVRVWMAPHEENPAASRLAGFFLALVSRFIQRLGVYFGVYSALLGFILPYFWRLQWLHS